MALKSFNILNISSNILLEIVDYKLIQKASKGDVFFYPVFEKKNVHDVEFALNNKGLEGYFKAKIHDGKKWCILDVADCFKEKENRFSKYEIPLNIFCLIKDIFKQFQKCEVYQTYREHYCFDKPQKNEYVTKQTLRYKK